MSFFVAPAVHVFSLSWMENYKIWSVDSQQNL